MFSKLKRFLTSVIPRRARARRHKQEMSLFHHTSYAVTTSNGSVSEEQSDPSVPTAPLSDGLGYDADDGSHLNCNNGSDGFSLYDLYMNSDDEENNRLSGLHAYNSSFYAGSSASLLSHTRYSYSENRFDHNDHREHQESRIHEVRDIVIRNLLYRVSIIRQLNSVAPMSALEDSLSFNIPPPFNKDIGLGYWLAPFFGSQQFLVRVEQILGVVPQIQRKVLVHPPCAGQYYVMDSEGAKYLMKIVDEDGSYLAGPSSSQSSIPRLISGSFGDDIDETQTYLPGDIIHAYIHNRRYSAMVMERLPVLFLDGSDSEYGICKLSLEAKVSHSEPEGASVAFSSTFRPSSTKPYPTPPHDDISFLDLSGSDCASSFVWKKRSGPSTVWWLMPPGPVEPEFDARTDSDDAAYVAAERGECGMDSVLGPASLDWNWETESWIPPTDRESDSQPPFVQSPRPSRLIDVGLVETVESRLRGFV